MDEILDHADRAVARLLMQYKGKPNREALVRALCSEVQTFEGSLFDVYTLRSIGNATGVQLDGLGVLVGEARAGKDDDTYRNYLAVRMLINRSSGTPEEILEVFSMIAGAGLRVDEWFPAAITLRVLGPVINPAEFVDLLQQAKDGGVRAVLEWLGCDPSLAFTFDTGPGFDSGQLAGALE